MEREDAEWVPLLTLKIVALCVLNPSDAFFISFYIFIFEIVFLFLTFPVPLGDDPSTL